VDALLLLLNAVLRLNSRRQWFGGDERAQARGEGRSMCNVLLVGA
jgi:hypothetical protein